MYHPVDEAGGQENKAPGRTSLRDGMKEGNAIQGRDRFWERQDCIINYSAHSRDYLESDPEEKGCLNQQQGRQGNGTGKSQPLICPVSQRPVVRLSDQDLPCIWSG